MARDLGDRFTRLLDDPDRPITELPVVLLPLLRHRAPHYRCLYGLGGTSLDINGQAPPPPLAGWKDTVYTPPGTTIRLTLRFAEYTDPTFPYMFHCHLMRHEDQGMMGQFLVLGADQRAAPMQMPTDKSSHHGGH
ncbi:hypothetical protein BFL43_02475 [Williamsia sp. 1135]|nr:hypothetical protein BFL43_02475 [Williamsia sp. 1135]